MRGVYWKEGVWASDVDNNPLLHIHKIHKYELNWLFKQNRHLFFNFGSTPGYVLVLL